MQDISFSGISTSTLLCPKKNADGASGFIDIHGKWRILPIYSDTGVFREGVCWVKPCNSDKWGLIDENGVTIIPPLFEDALEFCDGRARIKLHGKWGLVDKAGNILVEPRFDLIRPFKDGVAIVVDGDKSGFIFADSWRVIEPCFEEAFDFSEGLAAVAIWDLHDGKYRFGYVDEEETFVIAPEYNAAWPFHGGMAYVEKLLPDTNNPDVMIPYEGIIDRFGHIVERFTKAERDVDFSYEDDPWEMDMIRCVYGFIGHDGKFAIPPKFEYAHSFDSNGLSKVKIDGKWGLIDASGAYVVEPYIIDARLHGDFYQFRKEYLEALHSASEEKSEEKSESEREVSADPVLSLQNRGIHLIETVDSLHGVADGNENIIVKPIFPNITGEQWLLEELSQGYLRVAYPTDGSLLDRWGVMTADGAVAVAPEFEYILPEDYIHSAFAEGMARIREVENFGFVDCSTGMVITPIYSYVWPFSRGRALVRLTEKQMRDGEFDSELLREPDRKKLELFRCRYAEATIAPLLPSDFSAKNSEAGNPDSDELPFHLDSDESVSDELPF